LLGVRGAAGGTRGGLMMERSALQPDSAVVLGSRPRARSARFVF
jgi:hypothetical protein